MLKDLAIGFVVFLGVSVIITKAFHKKRLDEKDAESCGCNHNKDNEMER